MKKKIITVGEMFSGPGGIGLALNKAENDKFRFVHVWATDYDKDTCNTYTNNVLKNQPKAIDIELSTISAIADSSEYPTDLKE